MISVRNLTYRYPQSSVNVLTDISIDFPNGSYTALMGANGSGKSTLAMCMTGLRQPVAGEVIVDGMSVSNRLELPEIRRRIGLVFQDPTWQMTSATVERELAFGLQNLGARQEHIHHAVRRELETLGLQNRRLMSPSSLSGGERQRLAGAATLIVDPTHVILDEPTSFLSNRSRRALLAGMLERRERYGTTIILITQFLDEALQAERLIVLSNSRIVFDGIPAKAASDRKRLASWGIFVPQSIVG